MLKRVPDYALNPDVSTFADSLHFLVLSKIHVGRLKAGDRLPSIRDIATRSGVDHRVAARAYRMLESEGLVEVRQKSGVFVSGSRGLQPKVTDQVAWAAEILLGAWERGITRSGLCGMFGGMVSSPVRCGCIESDEDHMVALAGAIGDGLDLEVVPIRIGQVGTQPESVPADLADVDVIATSVLHAGVVREWAARAGKPFAVLNLHREFTLAVAKRCRANPVTVVMVDPEFARRTRELCEAIDDTPPERFVSVEQAKREKIDFDSPSVLITRAARRRLKLPDYHLLPNPQPVSSESARALCEIVAAAAPLRRARHRFEGGPADDAQSIDSLSDRNRGRGGSVGREGAMGSAEVVRLVTDALRSDGLLAAVKVLNSSTQYRFTGLYRFEPEWVRSVVLFDRENPHLQVGADVPMRESYCAITAHDGANLRIENALADPRLMGHAAQAAVLCYCAVHLLDSTGASWGTLCHYDFRPAEISDEALATLEAVRPLFQGVLGPAIPHMMSLPECVEQKSKRERLSTEIEAPASVVDSPAPLKSRRSRTKLPPRPSPAPAS